MRQLTSRVNSVHLSNVDPPPEPLDDEEEIDEQLITSFLYVQHEPEVTLSSATPSFPPQSEFSNDCLGIEAEEGEPQIEVTKDTGTRIWNPHIATMANQKSYGFDLCDDDIDGVGDPSKMDNGSNRTQRGRCFKFSEEPGTPGGEMFQKPWMISSFRSDSEVSIPQQPH
eukprot:GHVN01020419.1.p1 GENE.GHVN01020419.1~~GHVN01020419.1.p1  ORF type:complete len:169 (-),score=35.56 GHVN01020419.1:399-905(-)